MNHPGIRVIGEVIDDGETITVRGWMLDLCASGCGCHIRNGTTTVTEDQYTGSLGLAQHRACDCCCAWTVDELAAIVDSAAEISGMQVA